MTATELLESILSGFKEIKPPSQRSRREVIPWIIRQTGVRKVNRRRNRRDRWSNPTVKLNPSKVKYVKVIRVWGSPMAAEFKMAA
jgi:hypothetical protein